ncbi:tryptophan--tRNA ligase [bacterium]|nr:tryptophan--tRNA ligase [bacterium]NBX98356.1 tryptophan--tRNA ligase [bacterium]NDC93740.1 tryptophan--tRNA ligase [bacterium]NDD82881.1 tryptophan--tRNA ligase [bacterium]NDG28676.1 tryptophan--tRNA ligase [bacterium]
MGKPVILTGLRTNAEYHLGNYLGGILPMVRMQQEHAGVYQVNMFAPDLHSFTTEVDHDTLYTQTMKNIAVFVAAGMPIDSQDFYLYRQSFIPAHSELTVILNNFAYFGELSRMTQFKDKSEGKSNVTAGLFDYPVLMAADILLYGASYIPVGDDQKQHLELTRDLAIRLNNKFGDIFIVPKDWKHQLQFSKRLEGARIRSLRNPSQKMSKSVSDPTGTILLTDTPEAAAKKVKSAETDSVGKINWDWNNQPGITNLLQIYELLTSNSHKEVLAEWTGRELYGDLKVAVAEQVSAFLSEFQSNLSKVDKNSLQKKLEASELEMANQANITLAKVQKAVGLRP